MQFLSFTPEKTPFVFFELSVHCPESESLLNWNLLQIEALAANLLPLQYLELAAAIVLETNSSKVPKFLRRIALLRRRDKKEWKKEKKIKPFIYRHQQQWLYCH